MAVTSAASSSIGGAASAAFGLSISEKWIRERLNLQKDSLDDVRSLSLPGSYCEKITHLGRSLMGFSRLKHLDLSRNAIESLEGLQDLKHLETLNLYYNNVPSLNEVFKLGHNNKLKDLDLRLNPVTKNEPDYRLFVIHMLVNLRKLDDRGVRDSERKAALMHFDTDQANEFDEHFRGGLQFRSSSEERDLPPPHAHLTARSALVRSLAPRPTALEDDTDNLLDLISKSDQLLLSSPSHRQSAYDAPPPPLPPNPLTSHLPASRSLESSTTGGRQHQQQHHNHHHHRYQHKQHKHQSQVTPTRLQQQQQQQQQQQHPNFNPRHAKKTRKMQTQQFSPSREMSVSDDAADASYVHYADQSNSSFGFRGNDPASPTTHHHLLGNEEGYPPNNKAHLALKQLLALMQEHVAGDLTMLKHNPHFHESFTSWYSTLHPKVMGVGAERGGQMESLQGEVDALRVELHSMEGQLRDRDKLCQTKENRIKELEDLVSLVKSESAEVGWQLQTQQARAEELRKSQEALENSHQQLQQAKIDLSRLQHQVQALHEENKSLKDTLKHAPSSSNLEKAHKQIGELEAENACLKREMGVNLDRHKQDLLNAAQVQELATMLQEGHRSLVATNDHLLQELEEARQRHSQEIVQMTTNYEQLRKTVQLYT